MSAAPGRGAAVLAVIAAGTAGCGLGAGEGSEGEATLTVTRDYGTERVLVASVEDPRESDTVMRMLDREAEITTRYGGGFVQSIDGLAGGVEEGRTVDWFFFVNGIESDRGAAEVPVRGGDRIWWDRRDWTDALRTPAVVGSWPEPFVQASAGAERLPVRVECMGGRAPCAEVAATLAEEGVEATVEAPAGAGGRDDVEALRLLVGPWRRVEADPVAAQLAEGPDVSGVFARFEEEGTRQPLVALDERGEAAVQLPRRAGLVAALWDGEEPATWLVTGTDEAGVEAAVRVLDGDDLRDRYAVAAHAGRAVALPVVDDSKVAVDASR